MSSRTPDDIFNEARLLDASERAVFLESECGADPELRREVESLLEVLDRFGDVLEPPNTAVFGPAERLGRYDVLSEIGRGSMGVVYLAEDESLKRLVAIKVLPPELATSAARLERFRREAQLLAALDHPNIATIHSLEECDGVHFLTMEFVPGDTLAATLEQGPLSCDTTVSICAQIAAGLEAAHDRHVIHRDLKPLNVIARPDGSVKILDFGIAKSLAPGELGVGRGGGDVVGDFGGTDVAGNTAPDRFLGTPVYMSPEQVRGSEADHRIDIWALGTILYQSLCGRAPFPAESPFELIAAILEREPDWSALPVDTPANLIALMQRCLAKDAGARPATAGEVRAELERIAAATDLVTGETPARDARRATSMQRENRRNRTRIVVLVAAIALVAMTISAWFTTRGPSEQPRTAPAPASRRQMTHSGVARSPEISADGRLVAYVNDGGLGRQDVMARELPDGEPQQLFRAWNVRDLRWSPDGEHLLVLASTEPAPAPATHVVSRRGGVARSFEVSGHMAWSPDGSRFASGDGGDAISLIDVSTGQATSIPLRTTVTRVLDLDWSPDGRRLVLQTVDENSRRALRTVSLDGNDQLELVDSKHMVSPRWGPDSDAIYFIDEVASHIARLPVDSRGAAAGEITPLITATSTARFSLSRDSGRLVYSSHTDFINLVLGELQEDGGVRRLQTRQFTTGTHHDRTARFSPDGRELVFARTAPGQGGRIFVQSLDGDVPRQLTFVRSSYPAWSSDGSHIAFTSSAGGEQRVWLVVAAGGEPRQLEETRPGAFISWAPGERILYQRHDNRNYRRLDPESGVEAELLAPGARGLIWQVEHSPDGRWVAAARNRTDDARISVTLISVADGTERDLYGGFAAPIGWSADGRWIYIVTLEHEQPDGGGPDIKRVSLDGSVVERIIELPFEAKEWSSIDMSADGRRFVFSVKHDVSDIWLVDGETSP